MTDDEGYLTVVELKRYAYCPRIVFITHVLHHEEVVTEAMEMGREEHDERAIAPLISRLKASRVLRGVELVSRRLRIAGKPDYLVQTRLNEYIPIEVKWAESERGKMKWDHRLQLAAYALLIEENYGTTVKRGYAYYLREHKVAEAALHEGLKTLVAKKIAEIHEMIETERDPLVRVPISKCLNCGYKAYCRPQLRGPQAPYIKKPTPARGLKGEDCELS